VILRDPAVLIFPRTRCRRISFVFNRLGVRVCDEARRECVCVMRLVACLRVFPLVLRGRLVITFFYL
jgi:hypothetical protein